VITYRLCIAQQAHSKPCQTDQCPEATLYSCLYLSVSALKSPTEFHEQRKNLDSDKVIFANCLSQTRTIGYRPLNAKLQLKYVEFLQQIPSIS
jgi:hypothetical protein